MKIATGKLHLYRLLLEQRIFLMAKC